MNKFEQYIQKSKFPKAKATYDKQSKYQTGLVSVRNYCKTILRRHNGTRGLWASFFACNFMYSLSEMLQKGLFKDEEKRYYKNWLQNRSDKRPLAILKQKEV